MMIRPIIFIRRVLAGAGAYAALCAGDILLVNDDASRASLFLAGPALADDDDRGRSRRGMGRGGGGFRGVSGFPGISAFPGLPGFSGPRRPRSTPNRRAARRAPERQAVRHEWVAAGVTESDIARLRDAGFAIIAERRLTLLPEITVRLRVPRNLSERQAQARLQALIPGALLDLNHLYRTSARPCPADNCFPYAGPHAPIAGACPSRGTVGMIDTGIDSSHPALAGVVIETEEILGPGHRRVRSSHGTDVAILIAAGAGKADFRLIAVDAFHRRGGGATADSFDIVTGLDRLVAQAAAIANLSLAGPTNALLDRAGREAAKHGMLIVAAAGNNGPSSPPRYPAAYDWAVAVTAVDRRDNVYPRAVRGPHIAFAAPGVRVQLPDDALQPGPLRSGTSYAAPLVTAALSARLASASGEPSGKITLALATEVKDLGAPGRDPVFGFGLVDSSNACPSN
jgi:hypothetical protein